MNAELDGILERLNDTLADISAIRQGLDRGLPGGLVHELGPVALSGSPQAIQPQAPFRTVRIAAGAYPVSLGLSRRSVLEAPLATVQPGFSAAVDVGLQTRVWISGAAGDSAQVWVADGPIGPGLTGQAVDVAVTASLPAGTSVLGSVGIIDPNNADLGMHIGEFGLYDGNSGATAAAVTTPFVMGFNGTSWDRVRVSNGVPHYTHGMAIASLGTGVIWTPSAGKRFRLKYLKAAADTAGIYALQDGANAIAPLTIAAGGSGDTMILPDNGLLSAAANNALTVYNGTTATVTFYIMALGTEE